MNRRDCIVRLASLLAASLCGRGWAADPLIDEEIGNFRYIYSDPRLKPQFLDFLSNVFHLYPEQDLHIAIERLAKQGKSDHEVYRRLQAKLGDIEPFLGAIRYAIPALIKQKKIMADQTVMLLDPYARYEGHLEIGSTGRYIGILEDRLDITGDIYLLHTEEAGYGPEDIVERGQLLKIGRHVPMSDYSSEFTKVIPANSLDLVTVFIGFHHCPLEKREAFISSVRDVMKPGGKLILRDHDCHNDDMWRMAALAHDVFNAGTDESWQTNKNELRNFYSMKFIIDYLQALGLKHDGQVFFQRGDPTRNGLMGFTKV